MEQNDLEKIIKEAKRIEEDCLFSAKGHFNAAQSWKAIYYWIGIPASVFAAVAGASALAKFDSHDIIAGILALIVAILAGVSTFLNPNEKSNIHHRAGSQYIRFRNKARIFADLEVDHISDHQKIIEEIMELDSQRNDLNQKSPQIPERAYRKAKKSIIKDEAKYAVDLE
jgi:hypothetical protein